MDSFSVLLISAALALLYFVPAIVGRKKSNAKAIFALNLLLGWTAIGRKQQQASALFLFRHAALR